MTKESKHMLTSKTFWVNLIALVAILLGTQGVAISPEEQGAMVAGILAIVNVALRLVTTKPVRIKR